MKNRKNRAVEVCVCLLCVLLLTAVMMLCVYFTTERNQLRAHINNLTEERHQKLTKYEQILNHINNLTEEREQIFTKYKKMIEDKEHFLIMKKNLTEEREQIKHKNDELQRVLYEQGKFVFSSLNHYKCNFLSAIPRQ